MAAGSAPVMTEPFPAEGLPLEQARQAVLEALSGSPLVEFVPLQEALGRLSAAPVLAAESVPGFRAAILDGYAISSGESPAPGTRWELVGRSAPGAPYGAELAAGEAIRILTGAPLPPGAQRVLPQEQVHCPTASTVELIEAVSDNPWIRAADEETSAGQQLLAAGSRLGTAELARLASCGISQLAVSIRPRLALLITGDELIPPGERRPPGAIWESNGTLLESLLARLGYPVTQKRVVADDPVALRQALQELAACADVVVSTGGVSAGDSDWIRPLLAELGHVEFWKLFLKPGRPFAFGSLDGPRGQAIPFFGLPGNPVAAAITALQLLWPALQYLEGAVPQPLLRFQLPLAQDLRRRGGRPELARARLQIDGSGRLMALVEGSQASSRIGSLQDADLLLELPAEAAELAAGSLVWAQLLRLPIF